MKPGEVVIRSFDLRSSTEQGEKYRCAGGLEIVVEVNVTVLGLHLTLLNAPSLISAILKASDFTEVDRVECQFTTTATVFNNGSQVMKSLCFLNDSARNG
jgi:hypothetical protein